MNQIFLRTYIKDISLSRNTVIKKTNEFSSDIPERISCDYVHSQFCSLLLHENCDFTDNPRFNIFDDSANSKFEVIEELIGLEHLKHRERYRYIE